MKSKVLVDISVEYLLFLSFLIFPMGFLIPLIKLHFNFYPKVFKFL